MIAGAIESVLAQDFREFEHIIIDGGSSDDTLEILKQYPHLNVISEPDQGMYDALNKGLKIATGDVIGFLNTDDIYAERVLPRVAGAFNDSDVMAVAGRAVVFLELSSGKTKIVDKYSPDDRSLMECSTVGSNFFNAWFFRRSTFNQIGAFNSNYKIIGDRDFMFRFALNNLKYITINDLVYKYRMHADSLTFDKSGEKRTWCANENLAMTNFYLTNQDLPDSVRKLLIRLRTMEVVDMAARSIWMRSYKKLAHYSVEGLRYNLAWPLSFFPYIIKWVSRVMRSKRIEKRL